MGATKLGLDPSVFQDGQLGNMSESPAYNFPLSDAGAAAPQELGLLPAQGALPGDPQQASVPYAAAPRGPAAPAPDPYAGMTPQERSAAMILNNDPAATGADYANIDPHMQPGQPTGPMKLGSTSSTSVSRQLAPHGAAWDRNQERQEQNLLNRQGIRQNEADTAADLARTQNAFALDSSRRAEAQAQELLKMNSQQQRAEADYRARLDKTVSDQAAAQTAYLKAAKDYDPNRLMTGGNRAVAAIALAFGAFGSSLTHSSNSALEIINDAINRDIDKQKTGISAKKEQVTWLDHVMQSNRSRFQDGNAARLAARAAAKEVWAQYADKQTALLQGSEYLAHGKTVSDTLRMDAEQDRQRSLELEAAALRAQAGTVTSNSATQFSGASTGGVDVIGNLTKEAQAKILHDKANGAAGEKLTPQREEQAVKVEQQLSSLTAAYGDLKRYKDLVKKTDGLLGGAVERGLGTSEDAKRLSTVEGSMVRNAAKSQNSGNLSDRDVDDVRAQFTGGTMTSAGRIQKADEAMMGFGRRMAAAINSLPAGKARDGAMRRLQALVGADNAQQLLAGDDETSMAAHGGR